MTYRQCMVSNGRLGIPYNSQKELRMCHSCRMGASFAEQNEGNVVFGTCIPLCGKCAKLTAPDLKASLRPPKLVRPYSKT